MEQRRLSRARLAGAAQERRRVARDLHDGVQNELVSLILGLSLAEDARPT
jgi:signal transduction histidine kinase